MNIIQEFIFIHHIISIQYHSSKGNLQEDFEFENDGYNAAYNNKLADEMRYNTRPIAKINNDERSKNGEIYDFFLNVLQFMIKREKHDFSFIL